jgi:hypothetical protein
MIKRRGAEAQRFLASPLLCVEIYLSSASPLLCVENVEK